MTPAIPGRPFLPLRDERDSPIDGRFPAHQISFYPSSPRPSPSESTALAATDCLLGYCPYFNTQRILWPFIAQK